MAYKVWTPLGPDNMTARFLGDLLIRELDRGKKVEERQEIMEERWKHCLETLDHLHQATVEAGKTLGS